MSFEKPEVEFVEIDAKDGFVTGGSCTDSVACQEYGVETCLGAAPMNDCNEEVDWL